MKKILQLCFVLFLFSSEHTVFSMENEDPEVPVDSKKLTRTSSKKKRLAPPEIHELIQTQTSSEAIIEIFSKEDDEYLEFLKAYDRNGKIVRNILKTTDRACDTLAYGCVLIAAIVPKDSIYLLSCVGVGVTTVKLMAIKFVNDSEKARQEKGEEIKNLERKKKRSLQIEKLKKTGSQVFVIEN